jgi:hypothetical protein
MTFGYEDQELEDAVKGDGGEPGPTAAALDRSRKLVGIVSVADLIVETGDENLAGETPRCISLPGTPDR